MASEPCLRRCRVVRRYMPTKRKCHRLYVKLYASIHVSMYFELFREVSAVNTRIPCPKVPIHRKLGSDLVVECAQSDHRRLTTPGDMISLPYATTSHHTPYRGLTGENLSLSGRVRT